MGAKHGTLEERFWAKVQKSDGCWVWTANKTTFGHGLIRPGGIAPKILAHRASWILHNGPIPEGMWICHRCDNPQCVNPEHLFLGTPYDNASDRENKGRGGRDENWLTKIRENGRKLRDDPEWQRKTREAAAKRRKLSPEQENDARRLYANGETIRALSRIFRIDRTSIKRIVQS